MLHFVAVPGFPSCMICSVQNLLRCAPASDKNRTLHICCGGLRITEAATDQRRGKHAAGVTIHTVQLKPIGFAAAPERRRM